MSTQVGSIHYDLDLDDKKFSGKVDAASGKVNSFGDNVKRVGKVVATSFLAIGTSILAATGFAIKSAGEMEMLRSSMDTLTGSAEKGAKIFEDLNKFGAATPFETKDLAKATETMLAFGITAEDVLPNLQMLGDISLGNKDKLAGLSLAFSQVQSTGKLMGQDLLQMINQGFNPLTIISQKTGKSMATLKDEMAAGKISFDMVKDAMVTATSEGGLFFGGMERGSQTLTGVFSTMQDQIGMTVRKLVGLSETGEIIEGSLFAKVKEAIIGVTNFLKEHEEEIVSFVNRIVGIFTDMGTAIQIVFDVFRGSDAGAVMDDETWERWSGFVEIVQTLKDIIDKHLMPAFNELWTVIKEQLLPELKTLWELISPLLIPVLKVLGAILIGALVVGLRLVIEVLKIIITWVAEAISKFNSMVKFFKGLPQAISDALSGLKNAITKPFTDAWETVKNIASKIKNEMDKLNPFHRESPSLVDNITKGVNVIRGQFDKLGNIEMSKLPGAGNNGSQAIAGNSMQQQVQIDIGQVGDMQDVFALGREFAFRTALVPGSPE